MNYCCTKDQIPFKEKGLACEGSSIERSTINLESRLFEPAVPDDPLPIDSP